MEDSLFDDIQAYLTAPKEEGVLTPEQYQQVLVALATARGEKGFTEDEAVAVIRWAERQVVGHTLLELVLKGVALIDDPTGTFEDPTFQAIEGIELT